MISLRWLNKIVGLVEISVVMFWKRLSRLKLGMGEMWCLISVKSDE